MPKRPVLDRVARSQEVTVVLSQAVSESRSAPAADSRAPTWMVRFHRWLTGPPESRPPRERGWRWLSLGMFIYISLLGANAIAEIQERRDLYVLLNSELQAVQRQEAEANNDSSSDAARSGELSKRRAAYEQALRKLRHLSAAGALDSSMTVTNIRRALDGQSPSTRSYVKDAFGAAGYVLMPPMIDVSADGRMYSFLVLFASVLGCIVQYFREPNKQPMKTMIVGCGAGIVCYLGIASGRIDTVGSDRGADVARGILFGFLAGVFSVHVYDVVERAMKRLKGGDYRT
jgi:hypothetical protein